jgi:hypothetical protein
VTGWNKVVCLERIQKKAGIAKPIHTHTHTHTHTKEKKETMMVIKQ